MTPRRVAVVLGAALAVGVAAWWAADAFLPEATITIDRAQLQARLDARFPQKSCAMVVACLTLTDPVVRLTEGSGRIGLAADLVVELGHRRMPGNVSFSGVLRYVPVAGDFFLDDVRIDSFALTGLSPDLVQVVRVRGPAALKRALEGHPIYTLRDDTMRSTLARLAVRDVRVVDGRVRVSFVRFGG